MNLFFVSAQLAIKNTWWKVTFNQEVQEAKFAKVAPLKPYSNERINLRKLFCV